MAVSPDQPPTNPFGIEGFRDTQLGQLALRSIAANAQAIIEAADLGSAPLIAIIPELEGHIDERLDWAKVDSLIREWLAADFKVTGRSAVPTHLPHKGFCYARRT
jgi:hypothetical protein